MNESLSTVTLHSFGMLKAGQPAQLYTLRNARGVSMDVTNYGGIVARLFIPDRKGHLRDVVLGYETVDRYEKNSPYFGALIGRVGNRIANGKFKLDGKSYTLATNNTPGGMPCHLHGGLLGFDKVLWQVEPLLQDNTPGVRLTYRSKDGEEGYPGDLEATVHYWLTNENEFKIDYSATTGQATPVNLTQHSYFNLCGEGQGDVLEHVVTIHAGRFTAVNEGLIPTGEIRAVEGTPMDFLQPTAIGAHIAADYDQLKFGGGYDHNWILDRKSPGISLAASVYEPTSGRRMEVWTEEPGVQFYSGNFLNDSYVGKSGRAYGWRNGFCLETQHAPDSPNHPSFPSVILRPGQIYRSATVYRFFAD